MASLIPEGIGLTVFIVAISGCLAYYIAKFMRIFFLIQKFDGPPAVPVFGNTLSFKTDPRENFLDMKSMREKYREKTGGLLRLWNGPMPVLVIYSAKHCEALINSSRHINKGGDYKYIEPWLGKGLLTSGGQKWFHRRKQLTPTFHFSILQNFLDVFNEQSNILVNKLEKFAVSSETVNIFPLVTHCVLDIICDTAMGKYINAQGDDDNAYVQAVARLSHLVIGRIKNIFWWPDWIFHRLQAGRDHDEALKILHGVTNKMIHERLSEPPRNLNGTNEDDAVAGKRKRVAFLDLLLHMHREDASFTLENIREEVDTFMFEGHDTTAAAITWAILLIGRHPEVQVRLHDELDKVFGTSDRPVTSDDLSKLTYLGCVLKESLRLIPSVPGITRTLDDDIVVDGKVVPKQTMVIIQIYGIHHDPEHYPDPERFDPDRFLPENSTKRHPFAFIPFSAGPRNCIGQKFAMMEDKVVLINILRRFSIESVLSVDEAKPTGAIILRPLNGNLPVKLSLRKK